MAGCDGARNTTPAAVLPAAPPPAVEENFAMNDSPSLQFLPRQQEARGWRLEQDPIVVPNKHLESYLEDEYPRFFPYDAVDVTVGKYAALSGPGFAMVEIFRFPDFVKSFGAYSAGKQGNLRYIDMANEAYEKAHSLHLWRGPFYVRVIGGDTGDNGDSLRALLGFVAEKMPAAPSKPAVLSFFPSTNRVPNSERYSATSGFSQTSLANSFQASFNVNGTPVEGLIIPATNPQEAEKTLNDYRALYVKNGKLLDPIPNLGEDNFTAEDRYLGRAIAYRIDRFVIAFNSFKDRQMLVDLAIATDQRIVGSIRKQLVSADKEQEAASKRGNDDQSTLPAWAQKHPH